MRAIRGGHVPGAVNIPYEENWVDPGTPGKLARREVANNRGMSLKSETDLRNLYSAARRQQGNDRLLPKRRALGGDGRCARQARLPQRQGLRFILPRLWTLPSSMPRARMRCSSMSARCARSSPPCRRRSTPWKKALAAMRAPAPK